MKYDQLIFDHPNIALDPGSAEFKRSSEASHGILRFIARSSTVSETDQVGGVRERHTNLVYWTTVATNQGRISDP
jgi:hypothetical protein